MLICNATGGGKSLTFQILSLTRDHAVTIVVSPLLALAKVQSNQNPYTKAYSLHDSLLLAPKSKNACLFRDLYLYLANSLPA